MENVFIGPTSKEFDSLILYYYLEKSSSVTTKLIKNQKQK